jgi:putative ABC transport system permease protein
MSNLIQDFRYGLRLMLRRPGVTVVAILSLALGIGANSAVFSVINTVLLRPLNYADPDKLVRVWGVNKGAGTADAGLSPMNFLDYRAQSASFEHLAGYTTVGSSFILEVNGGNERIQGSRVTANIFDTLGVKPALGRTFVAGEDQAGHERVVVLTNALWQSQFGGDPSILEKPIKLNGVSYTVIGVLAPNFNFIFQRDVDLFAPIAFGTRLTSVRHNPYIWTIGRLKIDITPQQADAELAAIASQLEQQYPEANRGWAADTESVNENLVKPIRPLLLILIGAVAFVLLIACANVANLSLVRSIARQKEMAMRAAIGASRGRLIRQVLTESVVLSLLGGAAGVLLAYLGLKLLVALNPINLPRVQEISLDARVLGFTVLVSVMTGIIFGLAPAVQLSKTQGIEALKEGVGRATGGLMARRVQSALIVIAITLSSALLIGAGLLVKSFLRLQSADPGLAADNLLTMQVSTSPILFPEANDVVQFWSETLQRLEAIPGVKAAAAASEIPIANSGNSTIVTVPGRPQEGGEDEVAFHAVSHNFFQTLAIPLVAGRPFTEQETRQRSQVIVVNEAFANKYFSGPDALGKQVQIELAGEWVAEIVGIVKNVHHEGVTVTPQPDIYVPVLDFGQSLIVRTDQDPLSMASVISREITQTGPKPPVYKIRSMNDILYDSVAKPRLNMMLFAIFSLAAFVLSAAGLYSLISYSVSQRTREIGVRMALGAKPGDVLKLMLRQGMGLAIVGATLGLVLSFALTGLMSSLLYGLSTTDTVTFVGVTLIVILVAILATYIPSRNAMKVEPVTALRYE